MASYMNHILAFAKHKASYEAPQEINATLENNKFQRIFARDKTFTDIVFNSILSYFEYHGYFFDLTRKIQ